MITKLLNSHGWIMCNKSLLKKFGADCAILIGELCSEYEYWKEQGRLTEDGRFFSAQQNIEENTGLSKYQQQKATSTLVETGILDIKKMGLPAKNYYKINEEALYIAIQDEENLADKSASFLTYSGLKTRPLESENFDLNNNKNNNKNQNNEIVTVPPSTMDLPTVTDVLEENKKEEEETAGRGATEKPRRNYTAKPQIVIDEENKKLNREQKRQLRILEMLKIVHPVYGPELVDALGDYLNIRIGMTGCVRADVEWFQKEWDENIYPAIQKYSVSEVVRNIREVVIPRQYRRCFISINSPRTNNFNDTKGYTATEITKAEQQGLIAIEEAKRNGTYRSEF